MKYFLCLFTFITMHLFSLQQDAFSNKFLSLETDEHFLLYRRLMIESSISRLEDLIQDHPMSYEMEKEIETLKFIIGS